MSRCRVLTGGNCVRDPSLNCLRSGPGEGRGEGKGKEGRDWGGEEREGGPAMMTPVLLFFYVHIMNVKFLLA